MRQLPAPSQVPPPEAQLAVLGLLLGPQVLAAVQPWNWQSLGSVTGAQSVSIRQSTHTPAPVQNLPAMVSSGPGCPLLAQVTRVVVFLQYEVPTLHPLQRRLTLSQSPAPHGVSSCHAVPV